MIIIALVLLGLAALLGAMSKRTRRTPADDAAMMGFIAGQAMSRHRHHHHHHHDGSQ